MNKTDIISPEIAKNLSGLFRERVERTPDAVAYRQFDPTHAAWKALCWNEVSTEVARWQAALLAEGLQGGDRVAVMVPNCSEWAIFDQAALGLGLVTVPLYPYDRGGNIGYILQETETRLLFIGDDEQWQTLYPIKDQLDGVERIVSLQPLGQTDHDRRLKQLTDWLSATGAKLHTYDGDPNALASIVYTSGTTGRPKGVMLSYDNILCNVHATLQMATVYPNDLFLSFLPLSHMFERTIGYYLPIMAGATVAYARSVKTLAEDLIEQRPTVLVSVPRIYERIHARINAELEQRPSLARQLFRLAIDIGWTRFEHQQGRGPWRVSLLLWPLLAKGVAAKVMATLGGRLRLAVSGGAALSADISKELIALGLPLLQGYGLTEHSPVISANTAMDNDPASVGIPLPGVEVRIGEYDELQVRSRSVMQGYWNDAQATAQTVKEGWLLTGDQARIQKNHIYIIGRLKEIIVLDNGEKIVPADIEKAIVKDPLFEQVMVIGDGRPYLSALIVPNRQRWQRLAAEHGAPDDSPSQPNEQMHSLLLEHINQQLPDLPKYAQIRRVALIEEPWSIDNGLLTPTLKFKRNQIIERYHKEVAKLYERESPRRRPPDASRPQRP